MSGSGAAGAQDLVSVMFPLDIMGGSRCVTGCKCESLGGLDSLVDSGRPVGSSAQRKIRLHCREFTLKLSGTLRVVGENPGHYPLAVMGSIP